MNRGFPAVFSLFLAAATQAPAATYNYISEPFYCTYGDNLCFTPDGYQWKASFTIDERMLPGRSLANGTLTLQVDRPQAFPDLDNPRGEFIYTLSFMSPSGSIQSRAVGNVGAPGSRFDLGEFMYTVFFNIFTWTFDKHGQIIAWNGDDYCGGSCDQYSNSVRGDWIDDGSTTNGPGTWTRVAAPVPLPAAGPALALALGAVALVVRRKRKGRMAA